MDSGFDKQILFNNISHLVKEQDMKIGDFEAATGVSTGYVARASKDGNAKPGIDFIVNAAHTLDVSLDILLKVDISGMNTTEKYLASFIKKLTDDTLEDKLDWEKETSRDLNNLWYGAYGNCDHPLFSLDEGSRSFFLGNDYEPYGQKAIFFSHTFYNNTEIIKDCYNLRMKNGTVLYVMNVSNKNHSFVKTAKELWMCQSGGSKHYLCSTRDSTVLEPIIETLYTTINEASRIPKIKKDLLYVIDAYMENNDLSDDFINDNWQDIPDEIDDELPFMTTPNVPDDDFINIPDDETN